MAISGNVSYSGLRLVFLVCGTQHDGTGSVRRRRPPRNDHFHLLGCEALHEAPNEGNLTKLRAAKTGTIFEALDYEQCQEGRSF